MRVDLQRVAGRHARALRQNIRRAEDADILLRRHLDRRLGADGCILGDGDRLAGAGRIDLNATGLGFHKALRRVVIRDARRVAVEGLVLLSGRRRVVKDADIARGRQRHVAARLDFAVDHHVIASRNQHIRIRVRRELARSDLCVVPDEHVACGASRNGLGGDDLRIFSDPDVSSRCVEGDRLVRRHNAVVGNLDVVIGRAGQVSASRDLRVVGDEDVTRRGSGVHLARSGDHAHVLDLDVVRREKRHLLVAAERVLVHHGARDHRRRGSSVALHDDVAVLSLELQRVVAGRNARARREHISLVKHLDVVLGHDFNGLRGHDLGGVLDRRRAGAGRLVLRRVDRDAAGGSRRAGEHLGGVLNRHIALLGVECDIAVRSDLRSVLDENGARVVVRGIRGHRDARLGIDHRLDDALLFNSYVPPSRHVDKVVVGGNAVVDQNVPAGNNPDCRIL